MSKYERKDIRGLHCAVLGERIVYHDKYHNSLGYVSEFVDVLNQETAPLLDELATKDAVILAQTERIKELERELAKSEPRFKVGDKVQNYGRDVVIEKVYDNSHVDFSYLVVPVDRDWKELIKQHELQPLAESEADNG